MRTKGIQYFGLPQIVKHKLWEQKNRRKKVKKGIDKMRIL